MNEKSWLTRMCCVHAQLIRNEWHHENIFNDSTEMDYTGETIVYGGDSFRNAYSMGIMLP
jgi:acetate kinase